MGQIIQSIKNYAANSIGKRTDLKLVAFLVDDYGGVRTRGKEAVQAFRKAGITASSRYLNDTLSSEDDLSKLFDVLTSVKDCRGNNACFTPLVNIANPDFDRIKADNFEHYYREPFTDTLSKYGYKGAYQLWKEGMDRGIFHPEYHGTEHVDIRSFISALKAGHKSSVLAFENESTACPLLPGETEAGYTTKTFHITEAIDNESLKEDIKTGIEMFRRILGYSPQLFTPGAGEYSPALNGALEENGIKYIDVQRYKAYPLGDGNYTRQFLYNGKRNEFGQYFYIRNVAFEPVRDDASFFDDCTDYALAKMNAAFNMHCPAIISSHRANYVTSISPAQGEFGLAKLQLFLKEIVKRWPDVVFVNGSELMDTLMGGK